MLDILIEVNHSTLYPNPKCETQHKKRPSFHQSTHTKGTTRVGVSLASLLAGSVLLARRLQAKINSNKFRNEHNRLKSNFSCEMVSVRKTGYWDAMRCE